MLQLNRMNYGSISDVEQYMEDHDFIRADKMKVRRFLKSHNVSEATLTKNTLYFRSGGCDGQISRALLGLQDNFS